MRKYVLMLTAAMLVLTASVYGAEKSEKKLSVKPFSVINVVGSIKVVYEQGSTYEVRLVGDAAAFDRIRVGSNGSDLNISKYGKVTCCDGSTRQASAATRRTRPGFCSRSRTTILQRVSSNGKRTSNGCVSA